MRPSPPGPRPKGRPKLWLDDLLAARELWVAAHHSRETIQLRRYHIGQLADAHPTIGPREITTDHLLAYIADRAHWNPSTARSHRTSLRTFFRALVERGLRPDNPADRLPKVKTPRSRPRPCPSDAARHALESAGTPRDNLLVRVAVEAGLRRAEIAALRRSDITTTPGASEIRITGKGGHVRLVPISDNLAAELHGGNGEFVFASTAPSNTTGHLSPAHVGKLISRLLPADYSAHTLRHRFASTAYAAERDIRAVQELLGHASVATTQIYTAIPTDAMRIAAEAARFPTQQPITLQGAIR